MSGYRGGIFVCPYYSRDYRDYLNCEGAQVKLPKEELDRIDTKLIDKYWKDTRETLDEDEKE